MNAEGKIEKVEFDPKFQTAAENTVKFPRYGRMKNENLHGALQQKFHFLRDTIEVTYLEALHKNQNLSKVSALLAIMAYLYNTVSIIYK